MAVATTMYNSGKTRYDKVTRTSEEAPITKGLKVRRMHKAFLRYHGPKNWPLLRDALKRMGRADLIGNGKQQLIPARQPATSRDHQTHNMTQKFMTQHTGSPHARHPRKAGRRTSGHS